MLTKLRALYASIFTTIRSKLIAIVSFIIIISVLLFTGISLNMFQSSMTEMVKLNNGNNAKMLTDKVEGELRTTAEQLRLLTTLSRKSEAVQRSYFSNESDFFLIADFPSLLEEASAVYTRAEKLSRFNLTRSELVAHLKFSEADQKEIREGKTLIRALTSPRQHVWLYVVPATPKGERAIAAIMNGDSLSTLLSAVKSKGAATSLYAAMLVDEKKKLVAHSENRHFKFGQDISKHPIVDVAFKNFAKQVVTGVQRYTIDDTHEYGSYRKLTLGGALITTVNEDVALAGVRWARVLTILIALLTIAVAFLFIYFFSRTISDPLKRLVGATKTIRSGNYDVHLEKTSNDETGELTQAFNEMAVGLKERENLKGAFGKFVNKEVAKMVMKGDLSLGGETKTATVFFSDIRSFTSISEKLTPQEVVGFLNEYMTLMVNIVHK
ncbi:MAG TPA: HAMP domain-containing protein, partial [Turneriella sp.]|nr:HAMP domain-containing protein [Turneriella sp.]